MDIYTAEKDQIKKVLELRLEVFVNEQNVPRDIELDGHDDDAVHIIAEEDGSTVGCARVIICGGDAHIGRLAVKKSCRGRGVGTAVCKFTVEYCISHGCEGIWLNAQLHAVSFYERLGFKTRGDVFTEAGIEHIKMVYFDR